MLKLVIADDEGKTTVVPLVRDEITIGRREGNTIRLTERNVSRRHARLRRAEESYFVEDLQSYNGVRVNGRRIAGEVAVKPGDQIVIGDYQLGLQLEESATVPNHSVDGQSEPNTALIPAPTVPATAPFMPGSDVPYPHSIPVSPARLVMVSPPAPNAEFALTQAVTRVGRAEELGIWINHRSISREHAEITNQNGIFRIRDLRSANGVRVNSHDTKDSELRPGDFIELGQVRFRFVGPGEHFVFDADRTIQVDAATPRRARRGAPLVAVIAVIGLALLGSVALALVSSNANDEPQVSSTPVVEATMIPEPPSTGPTPPAPVRSAMEALVPNPELRVSSAVSACRAHLNALSFDDALSAAESALALAPDDSAALACRDDATRARHEAAVFQHGLAAYEAGDFATAFAIFEELPEDSEYRERSELERARHDYAAALVDEAEDFAESDPEHANDLLDAALEIDSPTIRRRATRIRRALQGARRVARTERVPRRARATATSSPAHQAAVTSTSTATATNAAEPPPPPPISRMAEAQACGMDQQCIVRALQHASTAPEMALLIETQMILRQTDQALDQMTRFVRRFPSHTHTAQYRQILMRHGR